MTAAGAGEGAGAGAGAGSGAGVGGVVWPAGVRSGGCGWLE